MKYIVNIIALLLLTAGVFAVIKFKDSDTYYIFQKKMERTGKNAGEFMQARKTAVQMEMAPTRRRPVTFVQKEEQLRMFVPDIFQGFNEQSWQNFWNFIYNPIEDKSGKFATKRHRTKEEIEAFLVGKYPQPFSRFRQDHWFYFWEIILGND